MKKLAVVLLVLLLVGCTLPDILDDIVITPTPVGVIATSTPTVTPVIVTATPEPPTATPTLTPTPEGFIPSPTPIIHFEDGCVWNEQSVVCQAEICVVRSEPLPGSENEAYTVPRNTSLTAYAVCELGNESWFYVGVTADNKPLWARNLDTVWIPAK